MTISLAYFSASWCAPCKTISPLVQRIAQEFAVPVQTYDVDTANAEVQKYGVVSVPTLVFMSSGQPVTSLLGTRITRDAVVGILKQLGVK